MQLITVIDFLHTSNVQVHLSTWKAIQYLRETHLTKLVKVNYPSTMIHNSSKDAILLV